MQLKTNLFTKVFLNPHPEILCSQKMICLDYSIIQRIVEAGKENKHFWCSLYDDLTFLQVISLSVVTYINYSRAPPAVPFLLFYTWNAPWPFTLPFHYFLIPLLMIFFYILILVLVTLIYFLLLLLLTIIIK